MIIDKSYQSVRFFWNSTENGSTMHLNSIHSTMACIFCCFASCLWTNFKHLFRGQAKTFACDNEFSQFILRTMFHINYGVQNMLGLPVHGKLWFMFIKTLMLYVGLRLQAFIGMNNNCLDVLVLWEELYTERCAKFKDHVMRLLSGVSHTRASNVLSKVSRFIAWNSNVKVECESRHFEIQWSTPRR